MSDTINNLSNYEDLSLLINLVASYSVRSKSQGLKPHDRNNYIKCSKELKARLKEAKVNSNESKKILKLAGLSA